MPKRLTDAEFPFPADVFAGPFITNLPPAEQVAIVKLWSWAWLHDGRVPIADAQAMGQISMLGEAWSTSALAAAAGHHFNADGTALAIAAPFTRRQEWRRKSAEGGRRSGIARRTKGGSTTVPPPPPQPRTTLQPPLNDPSTTVPRIDATPVREIGCAPSEPPMPVSGATMADSPPIPPLRETSFIESTSQGGGGGGGEGGGGFTLVPDPTPAEIEGMVHQVAQAYAESVRPAEPVNERARANIRSLLKRGTDVGALVDACRHYGEWCDRAGREPQYRKAPHNFFSRNEAVWRQHIDQRVIGGATGLACFAERLKVLCPDADGWFFAWGERHAARNDFSKIDDPQRLATWWATFHQIDVTAAEAEDASLWMTTKPKVANRAANRDTMINRIRHARLGQRTPKPEPTEPAVPETRRTGFDYVCNDEFRKKIAPHEFENGVITDAALIKHGYNRDGSRLDGLDKSDVGDNGKVKAEALRRLGFKADGTPLGTAKPPPAVERWNTAPR